MQFLIGAAFAVAFFMFGLALFIWRSYASARGSRWLSATFFCAFLYAFFTALELCTTDLFWLKLWIKLLYFGCNFIYPCLFCFVLEYTGRSHWIHKKTLTALFFVPVFSLLLHLTNDWHHLNYRREWLLSENGFTTLGIEFGRLFHLRTGYCILFFSGMIGLLVGDLLQCAAIYRRQLSVLLTAVFIPWLIYLLDLTSVLPTEWTKLVDFIPFTFVFTGLLLTWNIRHARFLNMSPVARDVLLKKMQDAVLVLDNDLKLVDFNPAAARLFGLKNQSYGTSAQLLIPQFLEELTDKNTLFIERDSCSISDSDQWWHITFRRMKANRLIVFHDNTKQTNELHAAQAQALTAAETATAQVGRELHDTVCQDLIALSRLTERIAGKPDAEAIKKAGEMALNLAKRTRSYSHLLSPPEIDLSDFGEWLNLFCDHIELCFSVRCEFSISEHLQLKSQEIAHHLIHLIREAVSNAIQHGAATEIHLDITRSEEKLFISISNNGTIPPPEPEWNDGLGMRHMRLRTALLNGQLTFRHTPQAGVTVEICCPVSMIIK